MDIKTRLGIFALCMFLGAAAGCSKKPAEQEAAQEPEPTATVDASTTGSITGTVTLEGTPPTYHAIDMQAEPPCAKANPKPVVPPVVMTGDHGQLANAVVYIKSGLGSYHFDTPSTPATLDQEACMYVPRVVALMTHQILQVKNTDPTSHNIHFMPHTNKQWNYSMPSGSDPLQTHFDKPELAISVMCNVHPWMRAFLFVFSNPYFEVTTKTGAFDLTNVPPGTYTIEAWQEKFGMQDQTVTIGPKESKSVSFTFHATDTH
jgi:Polysaccharide lyase family 4, domain II